MKLPGGRRAGKRRVVESVIDTDTDAAHRMFRFSDSMEGLPPAPVAPRLGPRAFAVSVYPGLLVALTIALAASWLAQHYGAPVVLFALLFGMTFHFLHDDRRFVGGVEFGSKTVLRVGVALLGARITLDQILTLGWLPIALVAVGVATTIGVGFLLSRALGQGRAFGVLSGGAVGICGASAALAIASVLPRGKASERDLILVVVIVTALSTIAMVLYPILVSQLGLDEQQAGLFLGGTIHDVAQVVGAGYMLSPGTGDVATYVKLLRVALLLPVVFAIALVVARGRDGQATGSAPFPTFLLGFAALVAANSLGLLPQAAVEAATQASRGCLVMAIAALGVKTSFRDVMNAGWRPLALIVVETAWIAALVLGGVAWLT